MEDGLIEKKRAQRKALLRALYGLVDGCEGFTITPMQYFTLGYQIGIEQDARTLQLLICAAVLKPYETS